MTWDGYRRIRHFCQRVRDELAEVKPRDFIDVQFFMWVVKLAEGLNAGPAMPAAPPRASIGDPQ